MDDRLIALCECPIPTIMILIEKMGSDLQYREDIIGDHV